MSFLSIFGIMSMLKFSFKAFFFIVIKDEAFKFVHIFMLFKARKLKRFLAEVTIAKGSLQNLKIIT